MTQITNYRTCVPLFRQVGIAALGFSFGLFHHRQVSSHRASPVFLAGTGYWVLGAGSWESKAREAWRLPTGASRRCEKDSNVSK